MEGTIEPTRTVLDDVWDSIATPGAGPGLIASINAALFALVVVAVGHWLWAGFNVHIAVLATLAVCLGGALNWYVGMVRAEEPAAAGPDASAVDGAPVGVAGAETAGREKVA
jgi:hypothetical protein